MAFKHLMKLAAEAKQTCTYVGKKRHQIIFQENNVFSLQLVEEIPGRPGAEEILRDLGFVRLYYPINKTPRQSVAARPTSSAWFQVMNPLLHERERAAAFSLAQKCIASSSPRASQKS